jgi:hypothetical protein
MWHGKAHALEACVSGRLHMKIGIFVHSNTGNTFSVAQKLQEKLQFISPGKNTGYIR